MFASAPKDMGLGVVKQEDPEQDVAVVSKAGKGFTMNGAEYKEKDFVLLDSGVL